LRLQNVDFCFKPLKNRIDCVHYTETNSPCAFNVCLFKAPKGRSLIEFQRRCGCVIGFRRLFQQALFAFWKDGTAKGSSSSSPVLPRPPPELTLDRETALLMLQTLCDRDVSLEYGRENLRVLSCLSKQTHNLAILLQVKPDISELLLQIFHSKDVETLRCAAIFLANVLSSSRSPGLGRKHVPLLFDVLSSSDLIAPGFSETIRDLLHVEVKRHIIRSLIAVSSKNPSIISQDSKYVKLLQETARANDSQLQTYANQALFNLVG